MSTEKKLFLPGPVPPALLAAARALRGEMTDAEQLLWQCLRRKQLGGSRFRRQHPFRRFVLDFYCCEARLAVELDGGQHNEVDVRAQDNERTEWLATQGIMVLRFWNSEIFENPEGVLQRIHETLMELSGGAPLPTSPPLG